VQPSAALDVGEARRLGRDQAIAEADLAAQRDRRRFLDEERVRAGVDGEAVHLFAEDHAARPAGSLEGDDGHAVSRQLVGRSQPGDSRADDDDVRGHGARSLG
jgi:hypothetical protein